MMKYLRVLTVQALLEVASSKKSVFKSNYLFQREQLLFLEWLLPQIPEEGARYEVQYRRYCEATGEVAACRVAGDQYIAQTPTSNEGYFVTRRAVEDAILCCKAEMYVAWVAATGK
jgi:hypothetical protein